jgi:AraC family transcriptional regulator
MQLHELVYAPERRQDTHAHEYSSISFIVAGELEEKVGSTRWLGGAGNVIVKPRHVEHEDVYGPAGARMFTVIVGDDTPGPYRWFFGGAQASLFVRAIRNWREGEPIDEVCADLIASAQSTGLKAVHSARMREVAERIATTDVTVSSLAGELSMHPVALARAFRREHGCSLTAYRRRARVRRAIELLTSTRMPLAEIAGESGFSDQSHLSRIFRAELGATPSSFRSLT